MEKREFPNEYHDFEGRTLLDSDGKLASNFKRRVRREVNRLLKQLEQGLESGDVDPTDYTIYTGSTGISLLYMLIDDVMVHDGSGEDLLEALSYIEKPLRHLKRRRVTFLCGDAGPLAVGAVLYHRLGRKDKSADCLKRLLSRQRDVCDDENLPNEVLFGRAGYLYALLYIQHTLGPDSVDPTQIEEVYEQIILCGKKMSKTQKSRCPLLYEWHSKKYLGAAHGMVGIYYVLMLVQDQKIKKCLDEFVRPSIDFLSCLRFPSGNYPSSMGSASGDKLVHWCHGAPGWIFMYIQAYKVFGDKKYLDEAKSCGEVLWSRGLLRKGYGICHGVAGNAYAFLALYRATGEELYLHRAYKFAEWCFDYGKHGCPIPDRPYSLFEGLAGTIHFLVDLLDPKHSRFPAFEL